jgi:hypothetical protein
MRIAFSGAHRVGKSTLLELVGEALPDHEHIAEPYHLLEEEGYEHSDPPSLEDFEAQLERSLDALADDDDAVLFDRCPADILAYLLSHEDSDSFEIDEWLPKVRAALKTLDLVVFVPIEEKDRIVLPAHEDAEHRLSVHETLREILVEDSLRFRRDVLVVEGSPEARARRVMKRVGRKRGTLGS